jgi:hypothetical protein
MGRPTLKTPELCAEICRRISEGETLTNICRECVALGKLIYWVVAFL